MYVQFKNRTKMMLLYHEQLKKKKKKTKLLKRQKQDVWLGSLGVTARELLHLGPSEPLTTILINHFSLNQMLMKKI